MQGTIHFLKNALDIHTFPCIIVISIHGGAIMLLDTNKMISITKLQRELTQKMRDVSETKEPLYVLRNNEVEAVIVSSGEYAALKEMEEVLEHFEVYEMVQERMKCYDPSHNVSLDEIRKRYGL
jgi:PHD/YefM family antitoxin component YafN of YafNO toxin-antitoxin module